MDPVKNKNGPCPKKKLDTNAVIAPTKNPVSAPKQTAEIITTATIGLNCGSIKNAVLPATASAHKTLITTSSRALGLRPSNTAKNGMSVSKITARLIK